MAKTSCTTKLISGEEENKILSSGKTSGREENILKLIQSTTDETSSNSPTTIWIVPVNKKDKENREIEKTRVFLPGESQGQRSLAGYCPWGCKSKTQLSD